MLSSALSCILGMLLGVYEDGLMYGFVAPIPKAANWAVGTFVFAAFGNYEFCLYRRRLERAHMKRAVEIIDRKKVEKEEAARLKREERRRLKEEADKKAEEDAKRKASWKFW
jgi:cytochrome c oxidase assembly protein subunit 20